MGKPALKKRIVHITVTTSFLAGDFSGRPPRLTRDSPKNKFLNKSIALRCVIPFHTDTNMKVLTFTTCVQRSDDSRILQFALRIAFRCVLHRHGNLDIHR
jgi:hypothetical protein